DDALAPGGLRRLAEALEGVASGVRRSRALSTARTSGTAAVVGVTVADGAGWTVEGRSLSGEGISMLNTWATWATTSWAGLGRALAAPIPAQKPTSPTAPTPKRSDARRHHVLRVSRDVGTLLRRATRSGAGTGSPSPSKAAR